MVIQKNYAHRQRSRKNVVVAIVGVPHPPEGRDWLADAGP